MRETLIPILRCPACNQEGNWELHARARDENEIRQGRLACEGCGDVRHIDHGIVDLLVQPPDFVAREADGLARFADVMRADGWDRERVLSLPYVDLDYWHAQANSIRRVLDGAGTALAPGKRILDVGSNTCWASAIFAERGLDVVALDISVHEMQGLRTADWWFEDKDVYFERVLSVMFAPALASASFDAIWCCEALHHNDERNMRRTLREFYRLLRPGGRLFIVNEPMRFPLKLKRDHGAEVAQFDGHEHVYFLHQYLLAARAAGFAVRAPGFAVRAPQLHPAPHAPAAAAGGGNGSAGATVGGKGLKHALREHRHAQRLLPLYRGARFAWTHMLAGDVPLQLDCGKPA